MRRQCEPPLLLELQAAQSPSALIAALKAVKNLIVGHELKKVEWIGHGILPLLSTILCARKKRNGKQAGLGSKSLRRSSEKRHTVDEYEAVFLQATGILCILAQGGTAFIVPILHSDILQHVVGVLSSDQCSSRVALGILRCLNAVADRLPPSAPTHWLPDDSLATILYSAENIGCWSRIIGQTTSATTSQQVCSLAIGLVCKTCTEEKQRRALIQAGILSSLSTRLASFVVAQGFVLPTTETTIYEPHPPRGLPVPAPATAKLSPVLQAVALLIEKSSARANDFLATPAITAVFPKPQGYKVMLDTNSTFWGAQRHGPSTTAAQSRIQNPIDSLLPQIPGLVNQPSVEHSNFPPLESPGVMAQRRSSFIPPMDFSSDGIALNDSEDIIESPLIAWLVYIFRAESGVCCLMAAKLLVILFKLGLVKKSRIPMFCKMLVPMLVRLLDREYDEINTNNEKQTAFSMLPDRCSVLEEAPAILAALVMDNQDLQKAAVDARAIKPLSIALKGTFDFLPESEVAMWWPDKASRLSQDKSSADRTVGCKGPNSQLRHTMRYREALLKALAALAPSNDDYRKAICDQGVLPCIIDSLKPMTLTSQFSQAEARNLYSSSGNPAATLLAACSAIRALTRSVSALRTNLIDAGVASPILRLLTNPDPEIRIAATKVVGNLAMDFSPMKETVGHQNVIKTLCEHAHSANPRLRFESLWSLKQLVVNSTNPLKLSVIQELGPSWMKQLISTDPVDIPAGVVIGLIDLDFPSRKMSSESTDDIVMDELSDSHRNLNTADDSCLFTNQEDDPNRHTIEDDTAIQEQLLDLIRNLFCGEKASEVIDYVFSEMDQRDFFDILLTRLRSRVIPGPTRKDNKVIPAPTGVVVKVLYIIVHIAASLSKYRNVVAANMNLMRQVLTYTTHASREIRAQCCWIAINLTYEDDPSDRAACKHRAAELQRVGYFTKLTAMEDDVELDVRERTKTALHLLRQTLT